MDRFTPHPVVLVTGASSGIGEALAGFLAEQGCQVFGTSRQERASDRFRFLKMDLLDNASIHEVVAEVIAQTGRIDVLVNNAGNCILGASEDLEADELALQMDSNFTGTVRLTQAVLPHMRARGSGKIITIGSVGGRIGLPFMSAYSASKAAIRAFMEGLSMEVLPFGITVAVVDPGDVSTPLVEHHVYARRSEGASAYREQYLHMKETYERNVRNGPSPQGVVNRVWKVIRAPRPALYYVVGTPIEWAGVVGKALLPSRAFETLFRKIYGLK